MNIEACIQEKSPTQNQEVAPCRFPLVNPHAKRYSSHPSGKLTALRGNKRKHKTYGIHLGNRGKSLRIINPFNL
jgi:hypothetical protein